MQLPHVSHMKTKLQIQTEKVNTFTPVSLEIVKDISINGYDPAGSKSSQFIVLRISVMRTAFPD